MQHPRLSIARAAPRRRRRRCHRVCRRLDRRRLQQRRLHAQGLVLSCGGRRQPLCGECGRRERRRERGERRAQLVHCDHRPAAAAAHVVLLRIAHRRGAARAGAAALHPRVESLETARRHGTRLAVRGRKDEQRGGLTRHGRGEPRATRGEPRSVGAAARAARAACAGAHLEGHAQRGVATAHAAHRRGEQEHVRPCAARRHSHDVRAITPVGDGSPAIVRRRLLPLRLLPLRLLPRRLFPPHLLRRRRRRRRRAATVVD